MRRISLVAQFTMMLMFSLGLNISYAQKFDQAYLNWKAQQEAQDRRLSQQQQNNYYLAKPQLSVAEPNMGAKININQANATELQQLSGIGQKKAEAIIQYRQQHGPFQQVDDLQKVKGIGPALVNKNRQRIGL